MLVEQVMVTDVVTCAPHDSLRTAAARFRAEGCGTLPVVGPRGLVVGVVTDRDVCLAAGERDVPLSALTVADAMSRSLHACRPGDDVLGAERIMRERQVRRLPVVDAAGALVGILSIDDLARAALRLGDVLATRSTLETLVRTSRFREFAS